MAYNKKDFDESEFNMAVSYLNRLNQWFYMAGESAMKLDAFGWFQVLTLIFRELSTEMKDEEKQEKDEEIADLNDLVVENQEYCTNTRCVVIPKDLWLKLHHLELYLRMVLRRSGLQMKIKEKILAAAKSDSG